MLSERINLRGWREFRNLTGAQLGGLTGLDRSTISRLEAGKLRMTIEYLTLLSEALDIDVPQLLGPPPSNSSEFENYVGYISASARRFHGRIAGAKITTEEPFMLLPVVSDEMEPTLCRGEYVIVNTAQTKFDGAGIFLVSVSGVELTRRLQMSSAGATATCDNPLYGASSITSSDMTIKGKVVAKISSV